MASAVFLLGEPDTPRGLNLEPLVQNNMEQSTQHPRQQLQADICSFCEGSGVDPAQDIALTRLCRVCVGTGKRRTPKMDLETAIEIMDEKCTGQLFSVRESWRVIRKHLNSIQKPSDDNPIVKCLWKGSCKNNAYPLICQNHPSCFVG